MSKSRLQQNKKFLSRLCFSIYDQRGHSHLVVPLIVVAVVAVIGFHIASDHVNAQKILSIPPNITLDNADDNKTITMYVKQNLIILLPNTSWTFSTPSNSHVLKYVSKTIVQPSTTYPEGTTKVTYQAEAAGKEVISARGILKPVCSKGMACPQYIGISLYSVTVHVINRS